MTAPNFSPADRDYLLEQLSTHVLDVDFVKVDGTHRTMKCTLVNELLPPTPKPVVDTLKSPKVENLNVISVWDLESKGWRSFRIDSVKSVTIYKWHPSEQIKERV